MAISKLSIQQNPQWLHIFKTGALWENYQSIIVTREELVDALVEFSDSDNILSKVEAKKLAIRREEYKKMEPVWFEYAGELAKKYWEKLKNEDNVKQIQYLSKNVSYNIDGTMNILALKKTFCEDISRQNKKFNFIQAQALNEVNHWWYKLMTDYNNTDTEDEKKQSDWFQVINIFSWGNGDTNAWMAVFKNMAWCNSQYWTITPYKDESWEEIKDIVRYRNLDEDHTQKRWGSLYFNDRVCGLKNMVI